MPLVALNRNVRSEVKRCNQISLFNIYFTLINYLASTTCKELCQASREIKIHALSCPCFKDLYRSMFTLNLLLKMCQKIIAPRHAGNRAISTEFKSWETDSSVKHIKAPPFIISKKMKRNMYEKLVKKQIRKLRNF